MVAKPGIELSVLFSLPPNDVTTFPVGRTVLIAGTKKLASLTSRLAQNLRRLRWAEIWTGYFIFFRLPSKAGTDPSWIPKLVFKTGVVGGSSRDGDRWLLIP